MESRRRYVEGEEGKRKGKGESDISISISINSGIGIGIDGNSISRSAGKEKRGCEDVREPKYTVYVGMKRNKRRGVWRGGGQEKSIK